MARFSNNKNKEDLQFQIISIDRVTRVVAGGKRLSFRVVTVGGDKAGKVGIGIGKGKDVSEAMDKAAYKARKNLIEISLVNGTIPHEIEAKYSSAKVLLKPAKQGRGIIAGGAARVILTMAGVKDVTCKILSRTTNKLTTASATLKALQKLKV